MSQRCTAVSNKHNLYHVCMQTELTSLMPFHLSPGVDDPAGSHSSRQDVRSLTALTRCESPHGEPGFRESLLCLSSTQKTWVRQHLKFSLSGLHIRQSLVQLSSFVLHPIQLLPVCSSDTLVWRMR